jgi:hypothetical protein
MVTRKTKGYGRFGGSESGRTDKNYRIRIDVDGIEQKRAIGCAQDDGESGSERKE